MSGGQIVLQAIEDAPAIDIRQVDVERDGVRPDLVGELQGGGAARGDQRLEAIFAGQLEQIAREMVVVLDDQQHLIAGLNIAGIVIEHFAGIGGRGTA